MNCNCLFKHDASESCEIVEAEPVASFKSRIAESYSHYIENLYTDYEREYAEKLDALEKSRDKLATVADWHQAFVEGLRPATGSEKVLFEFLYANRKKLTDEIFALEVQEVKTENFTDEVINHCVQIKGKAEYHIWANENEFGTIEFDALVIIANSYIMRPIAFKTDAELCFNIINANLSC